MICKQFEVVIVPFPFIDQPGTKPRPAVVLSDQKFNRSGNSVLAMITTTSHTPWPGDTMITDRKRAGLTMDCMIRLKLFTLDNKLITRRLGQLGAADKSQLVSELQTCLPWV